MDLYSIYLIMICFDPVQLWIGTLKAGPENDQQDQAYIHEKDNEDVFVEICHNNLFIVMKLLNTFLKAEMP